MRDTEVVASIVAGNPDGLATAYDMYAGDLYGYCQSLLHEPADAADAVQDTFVIAASKVGALRDPERLRSWLFAVARNECLHRLKARHAAAPLQDAPEVADEGPEVGHEAERAETVALVRAAVGGLNDGERDVINQLWHGLDVSEVAAVLGVTRSYAYTLFSRAREQLEASVGVLLVGRAGRRDCATLDGLLRDWDGRLTATLRKRVGRHIDKCGVCSNRKRQELTPALLYGLTPGALLALAAQRAVPAFAGFGHVAGPLSAVRDTVLRLAADPGQPAAAFHSVGGGAAHSFGVSGFPKPYHGGALGLPQLPHLSIPVVSGTAAVATATVVAAALAVGHHHRAASNELSAGPAGQPPGATGPMMPGAAGASGTPTSTASASAGATPSGTASIRATQPGSTPSGTGSGSPTATTINGVSVPVLPTATATQKGPVADAPTTGPTSSTGPVTLSTTSAPAPGPTTPATPIASPTAGPPSAAGTISVSPSTVALTPLLGGSLTLTANGGPVNWSISEPKSLLGQLTVSPSSGTLSAGQSATITITVNVASIDTTLTVQPGDQLVTVVLGPL